MERGVVIFRRVAHVFRQNGEKYYVLTPLGLEVEPIVTLEMAERMRREAEADSGVEQGQMARVQEAMEPKKHSQASGPVPRKKGSDVE